MSKWKEIATVEVENEGTLKPAYCICKFMLYCRGERHKATAHECRGPNQDTLEGERTTEGRSAHAEDAIGVMRSDVRTWAGDDVEWQARLSTAMRELAYIVEDANH